MEARLLGCVVATHWLLHTLVQIFFHLVLVHKKVWCSLSSLNIQSRVLAMTFYITLLEFGLSIFCCQISGGQHVDTLVFYFNLDRVC